MKIKTKDLTGVALDWAVGQALDIEVEMEGGYVEDLGRVVIHKLHCPSGEGFRFKGTDAQWAPSTEWAQGGPIIERMGTHGRLLLACGDGINQASFIQGASAFTAYGPTLHVAAMRCFVASRLGDTVEVPNELA